MDDKEQESDDGYDSDLFENPEKAAEFKCPICTCIAKDPVETVPCGHLYCRACLQTHISESPSHCPSCRELIKETSSSTFVERQILKLRVKCSNHDDGCDWKGGLSSFRKHLKEKCPFVSIMCEHCSSTSYLRGEASKHLDMCEEFPLCCKLCAATIKRKHMKQHESTLCPSLLVKCPNECGEQMKQALLSDHLDDSCTHRVLDCPYNAYGCAGSLRFADLRLHLTQFQMMHLELKVLYLERLAQSCPLLSISNATGSFPEISGLYDRETVPHLARPVWRNKNNKLFLVRYDGALKGWVLDKQGFAGEIVAWKYGPFATPTAREIEPLHVTDIERMLATECGQTIAQNKHVSMDIEAAEKDENAADSAAEQEEADEKKSVEEAKDKTTKGKTKKSGKAGVFSDGGWHIKGTVEKSRIKVKGYTEREFDLEWEFRSLSAKMRRQRTIMPVGVAASDGAANGAHKMVACLCGRNMEKRKSSPYSGSAVCNVCELTMKSGADFFHCPGKQSRQHIGGYDLCLSCAEARRLTQLKGQPVCDCGSKLNAIMSFTAYQQGLGVSCNVCKHHENGVVWHCPKGYNKTHERGFDLCVSCGEKYVQQKSSGLMSFFSR